MSKPQLQESASTPVPMESTQSQTADSTSIFRRIFFPLLLTVSIIVVCLSIVAIHIKEYTDTQYFTLQTILYPKDRTSGTTPGLMQYPEILDDHATSILLPSGAVAIPIALFVIALCTFVMRRSKSLLLSPTQRAMLWFFLVGNAGVSLAAILYAGIVHAQSDHFDPSYRSNLPGEPSYGPDGQYPGSFDIRTWTCEVSRAGLWVDDGEILARNCEGETQTFFVVLVLTLFNIAMAALVLADWLTGQRALVRGFASVVADYEKRNFLDDGNWDECLKGERLPNRA